MLGSVLLIKTSFHSNRVILGRCLVPVRVCTSPGRDRILEETKLTREASREADIIEEPPRKRIRSEGMAKLI